MSMVRTTVSAVAIVAGIATYAVYFDYKRRTDVDFRKKLKKDRKRVKQSVAASKKDGLAEGLDFTLAALEEALLIIKNEEGPKNSVDKEGYFLTQVADGERLTAQGPSFYLPAAMAFYRALRIYPNPADLIGIYEKTVPEPVFKLVVQMTNLDVSYPSSPLIPFIDLDEDTSPTNYPSPAASSQEWDKVTDPGSPQLQSPGLRASYAAGRGSKWGKDDIAL